MNLDDITPVILTRDEAPNIGRTVAKLSWAREVIVVDSGSVDDTVAIATKQANVRVVTRTFDDLASQWTFAVAQAATQWVLTLDADYIVPEAFAEELRRLTPDDTVAGFEAPFIYAVHGAPLRASLYPPRAVLLRRDHATFYMDGHTQRVRVDGAVQRLITPITHDDRKDFAAFVKRQQRYMADEARKLLATPSRHLPLSGKIRKLVIVAPLAALIHTLFAKRLLLDGAPGLTYAFERALAEMILSKELLRQMFRR
jgi:glycosyltransferase involved in cell wall biosynthesis